MATTITNQASLTYNYGNSTGTATSNVASAVLEDALSVQKVSVNGVYSLNSENTYSISVTNNGSVALSNVTVTDNLGTYTIGTSTSVTPLTYTETAKLYVNGVYSSDLSAGYSASSVTFTIPSISPGDTATIVYTATTNGNAPLSTGSQITNTATVTAATLPTSTSTATMTVSDYADVQILKNMSPATLIDGDTVTYTFTVYNYGNTEATDVVLTDTFTTVPTITAVTVNGTAVQSTDYTYTGGVLTLPASGSTYTVSVPAATFTQDTTTGAVTVTPGTTTIVVTGTI